MLMSRRVKYTLGVAAGACLVTIGLAVSAEAFIISGAVLCKTGSSS